MISLENGQKKDMVYEMWQRNFHDPIPYADFYFDEVYGKNDILLNVQEDTVKGMLHLNPYRLNVKGQSLSAHYIVGVATDEEFRRQGVMKELLEESFRLLRKQGEVFTYLMPADENYYLPFDFRHGSCQLEQEIECFSDVLSEEEQQGFEFKTLEENDLAEIAQIENRKKDAIFEIHTEITSDYLERLEKETCSDFGKLWFVYHDGKYEGRFVVGAENDYMVLSQIFCAEQENRERFLYEILKYCENAYHYGKYQLILDESWNDILKKAGNYHGVRVLPSRKRPIIMYRILNLEEIGKCLAAIGEGSGFLRITDSYLKEQSGLYEWNISGGGCLIHKFEDSCVEADCGEISIGDLTAFLFGNKKGENLIEVSGLTEKGKELLAKIQPLNLNCIQEIV